MPLPLYDGTLTEIQIGCTQHCSWLANLLLDHSSLLKRCSSEEVLSDTSSFPRLQLIPNFWKMQREEVRVDQIGL